MTSLVLRSFTASAFKRFAILLVHTSFAAFPLFWFFANIALWVVLSPFLFDFVHRAFGCYASLHALLSFSD